jgi:hypothetical protein
MGAFQSLKAQTFSRVVTVNRNLNYPQLQQLSGQLDTLFIVPSGKIFKIEYFTGSIGVTGYRKSLEVYINGVLIPEFEQKSTLISGLTYSGNVGFHSFKCTSPIWLKEHDVISFMPYTGNDCQIFLSGIEYDAQ